MGGRACGEGLLSLTHGRPRARVRRGGTRPPRPRGDGACLGMPLPQASAVGCWAAHPPSCPGLMCCSSSQTWGGGQGCSVSPGLASADAHPGGHPGGHLGGRKRALGPRPSLPPRVQDPLSCNAQVEGGLSPQAREPGGWCLPSEPLGAVHLEGTGCYRARLSTRGLLLPTKAVRAETTSLGTEGPGSQPMAPSGNVADSVSFLGLLRAWEATPQPLSPIPVADLSTAWTNATQWGRMGISVESEDRGPVPGSEPRSKSLAPHPKTRFLRCSNESRVPGTALSP